MDQVGDGVGDLPGLIARLGYLRRLGVDAVWVSPIYPSPMKDFGYDVPDYTGVHPLPTAAHPTTGFRASVEAPGNSRSSGSPSPGPRSRGHSK